MVSMDNIIQLIVGDYSLDGHERTKTFMIKTNLTTKQLATAYKVGSEKIGFDFINICCRDYEDRTISKKVHDAFFEQGFVSFAEKNCKQKYQVVNTDFLESTDYDEENDQVDPFDMPKNDKETKPKEKKYLIWSDVYTDLYLFVCWLGNQKFQFQLIEGDRVPIGGYGLL
jgi:hypothetical protein